MLALSHSHRKLLVASLLAMTSFSWADETTVSMPTRGICAHRGASATHPENTVSAFREAIRLGAHINAKAGIRRVNCAYPARLRLPAPPISG